VTTPVHVALSPDKQNSISTLVFTLSKFLGLYSWIKADREGRGGNENVGEGMERRLLNLYTLDEFYQNLLRVQFSHLIKELKILTGFPISTRLPCLRYE
jgi:hypothetical protein